MGKLKKKGGRPRKSKEVRLPPMIGDHGTGTKAATGGTEVVLLDGPNPNRIGRRMRVSAIDRLERRGTLSMRQLQAAREIEEAYCQVQMLSSGGELKEQVDSTPRPDAVVASQVTAMSRLTAAMSAVPNAMRDVVEHVCWRNMPVADCPGGYGRMADLKVALDLVANKMRY